MYYGEILPQERNLSLVSSLVEKTTTLIGQSPCQKVNLSLNLSCKPYIIYVLKQFFSHFHMLVGLKLHSLPQLGETL